MKRFDIAVAGNALAGKIAALALARLDYSVALIGPASERADERTTALMDQSIAFLDELGVWEKLRPKSAALKTMQIVDGTGRLFRAPTVPFRAADIDLDAFGYNFPNAEALQVLDDTIAADGRITVIASKVATAEVMQSPVRLTLDDGSQIEAGLAVAADGRKSHLRDAAGISVRRWSYPQTAVVLNFSHTVPHGNVSTEFHTPHGPFTQVPLPGDNSSLVWVQAPNDAVEFIQLSTQEMGQRVERQMQSMLGKVTVSNKAQAWPLSGMTASHFGKGPLALIGEASHAFPPIGAQGLNLSLRDIMALRDLLGPREEGQAAPEIGDAFDRARRADIVSRTASVDLLNRSLLSNFLPVQLLRAAGLHVLGSIGPLRNFVMHEGVAPGFAFKRLPALLRQKASGKSV